MAKNTLLISTWFSVFLFLMMNAVPSFGQHSLYSDIKANEVGDVITVVLMESISGSSSVDSETASSADGSAGGSVSSNFLPFQPTFGSDVQVQYDSDQAARASQGQFLEGFITVRIVEETEPGSFVIEGSRETEINGEAYEMKLNGIIRAEDINSRNQVYSFRVADAEITYQKKRGVRELTKQRGFIKRAVLTGVGVALGAAIILKAF